MSLFHIPSTSISMTLAWLSESMPDVLMWSSKTLVGFLYIDNRRNYYELF